MFALSNFSECNQKYVIFLGSLPGQYDPLVKEVIKTYVMMCTVSPPTRSWSLQVARFIRGSQLQLPPTLAQKQKMIQ